MDFIVPEPATTGGFTAANVTPQQQAEASNSVINGNYSFGTQLVGAAVAAPFDLADTVASSVGLSSRGQLNDATLNAIGSPGITEFYNQNRGAIEAASGVAGFIAADYLANRFLAPAGAAMGFLAETRLGARIATLDERYQTALRAVSVADRFGASRGMIGAEQFVGETTLPQFGSEAITVNPARLRGAVRWAATERGLVRNLTTEAIMATTLNQNSMFYSGDMSENLLWMGGGLGLGAAVDRLTASYALRKLAGNEATARAFGHALDPVGIESDRMDAALLASDADATQTKFLGLGQGGYTDRATSYMLSARTLQNTESTTLTDLASRRARLGTQNIGVARDEAQKATVRGINGVSGTGFSLDTPGLGNHIDMRLHDDPTALYGVEALGAAGPNRTLSDIHDTRESQLVARQTYVHQVLQDGGQWRTRTVTEDGKRVKKQILVPLEPDKLAEYSAEAANLRYQRSWTPQVSTGKEWAPMEIGRLLDNFELPKIRVESSDERKLWSVEGTDVGQGIGIGNDGELILPNGKNVNNLDLYDHLRLYQTANQAVADMAANQTKLVLKPGASWFQLDMAENLIRKTGDEGLVAFPPGMTRQTAQVDSFGQKVGILHGKADALKADPVAMSKARMQYNLPALSAYESGLYGTMEHPLDVILRGATPEGMKTVTYGDLIKGIQDVRKINGLGEGAKDKLDSLSGDMFRFLTDDAGKPVQPILAYRRPLSPFEWTKDDLAERMAMRKGVVRDALTSGSEITRNLTNTLIQDPDFQVASKVQGLRDIQMQSFLPGMANSAPQSASGGILASVVSRDWRARDIPELLAAGRIRQKGEALIRDYMRSRITDAMGDVFSRLNGPRNTQSKLLLNQLYTFKPGWDLIQEPIETELPNGAKAYQFGLDQSSAQNQRRWQYMFNESMPEDAILKTPQGRPVLIDDLGAEFHGRFQQVANDILQEKNTLLTAQGLGKINQQVHYVPPPNTKGKYIGFTLDAMNNPVPGGTIVASTPEEFSKLKTQLETDPHSPLRRDGHIFYTQDELRDFADVWDRAQMNFTDPGTTAIQPGKRGTGTLTGLNINHNAAEDAMTWMRDSYLQHGDNVMRTLFHDQINAAEMRAQIARTSSKNEKGVEKSTERSIYDHYVDAITGRLGITSPGSFVGRQYLSWEKKINQILAEKTPPISRAWKAAGEFARNTIPGIKSTSQIEAFNNLVEALGPHMPFKDVSELMESQHGITRPPELAKLTGMESRFEAAMRLRILEPMQGVMNLSGILNALPAVVRHVQPREGENMAEWAARTGNTARIIPSDQGPLGVLDTAKLAWRSFERAWSRSAHEDYAYMQGRGFITQEVAEFQKQFGAIKSKNTWQRFMFGADQPANRFQEKGLVGWTAALSDRSEDFSRAWGHMAGLELADTLGITEREAKHNFAHEIANKMIANYDPKNRPEIFQGALGAPIGLFQSFIWAYYQRLFRYIETGDKRAFATQYAMQGALYGATTLPGFSAVNSLFFQHSQGNDSPMDAIYHRFGQSTGDMLFGGVLSNLPKLFGAPGIDLYSRGDTNVRLPAVPLLGTIGLAGGTTVPFVDTASRILHGMSEALSMFRQANPNVTKQQLAEVASNMITNRPLAGFIEQTLAGGYDTDNRGAVVSQAANAMESIYRVMGTRSLRMAKEQQAFYSNRNQQEQQIALRSTLNESVRAAIRGGNTDAIPGYFDQYVRTGGDPTRFRQWVRSQFDSALTPRAAQQLRQSLARGTAGNTMTNRLLDMGVTVDEAGREAGRAYQITPQDVPSMNPNPTANTMNPAIADQTMNQQQGDPIYAAQQ